MKSTKIAFYSDLHTEFKFSKQSVLKIDNKKDFYIFAGDLANFLGFKLFITTLRQKTYKPVIVVLGNHDFYGQQYEDALNNYRQICAEHNNVILLEQDIYISHEHQFIIFGGTFWSTFENKGKVDKNAMELVQNYVPDFRQIRLKNYRLVKPQDQREIALQTLDKLKKSFSPEKLAEQGYENYTKIVVSHFPPLATLGNPIYSGSDVSAYFEPDYSALMPLADIWIYGHDHYNLRQFYISENQHKTLIVSNQHGYINEKTNQRECIENRKPVEIDYQNVTEKQLAQLGNDFYCDICLKL